MLNIFHNLVFRGNFMNGFIEGEGKIVDSKMQVIFDGKFFQNLPFTKDMSLGNLDYAEYKVIDENKNILIQQGSNNELNFNNIYFFLEMLKTHLLRFPKKRIF
jgi:hypothetical protein